MAEHLRYRKGVSAAAVVILLIVVIGAMVFLLPNLGGLGGLGGGGLILGAGPGTQGLVISSLKPEVTVVEGGTKIVVTVVIKNLGERPAGNVEAQWFGGLKDWQGGSKKLSFDEIGGIDTSRNQQGEEIVDDWGLTAPKGAEVDISYDGTVQMTYDYDTLSVVELKVVTPPDKNIPQVAIGSSTTTKGSFSITPSLISTTVSSSEVVRFQYLIKNIGGGVARAGGQANNVKISAEATDAAGRTIDIIECSQTGTQRLLTDGSRTIRCDVDVSDLLPTGDAILKLKLDYTYIVQSATSITVLKSFETLLPGGGGGEDEGEISTSITLFKADNENPDVDDIVTFTGTLSGTAQGGTEKLSDKIIKIVRVDNGEDIASGRTEDDGTFEINYKITSAEELEVKAVFEGDDTYASSESSTKVITPKGAVSFKPTCTLSKVSGTAYISDSKIWINPSASGKYKVTVSIDPDSEKEIKSVEFPEVGITIGSTDTSSPFAKEYSWSKDSDLSTTATVDVTLEDDSTDTCEFSVGSDSSASTTTSRLDLLEDTTYQLTLTCNDGTGSGCSKIKYCVVNSGSTCKSSDYKTVTGDNVQTDITCSRAKDIHAQSTDNVGNVEELKLLATCLTQPQ